MKLTIKRQNENPILRRTELDADIVFSGATPSREAVSSDIASQMKTNAEFVDIKSIKSSVGLQQAKALIYVYKDAASKKEMVRVHKKQLEKTKKAEEAKEAKENK